ncbi:SH3 domain-containing protein [candidate division KSB1 bacterium]|nr:SH3 domain-containing protein [candidate division KSB1 bacterium]
MGIVLQEHEFSATQAELKSATVTKVVTKGSGSIRLDIKAEPNAASATVVKVPGGIELELLESSKDWFKVKLPDGKQGYLAASQAQIRK